MEDIKPIDKFTLDKYVREEDDLLEYVEMLGCKCHPDYDFIRVKKEIEDRTETNETEVATEQQATEQQAAAEEEEETKYVFMGTTVTQEFKKSGTMQKCLMLAIHLRNIYSIRIYKILWKH